MKNVFISKTDLAQAFFPYIEARPARHKLMQVINDDQTLLEQLVECGYSATSHFFSPKQVDMIVERFGNPWK